VEITQYIPGRDLTWTTLTGVDHRLRVRLREAPNGTRVTLRFAYDSPGVLGSLADVAAFVPIRRALRGLMHEVARTVR
jgi:fatty-acyl-CoA synthase